MSDGEMDFGKKKKKKEKKDKKASKDAGSDDEMDFGDKKKKKDKKEKKEEKKEVVLCETEFTKGQLWDYDELLDRLHATIADINENGITSGSKYVLKPPQCARVGSKKTGWANFGEICELMNRTVEHVQHFVLTEFGCDGTMAAGGQLVLKGRFMQKNFEAVLKKYIKEFVTCDACRSPKTDLIRDKLSRLWRMQCNNCGAGRNCTAIKAGFTAQKKGARRAERNAAGKVQIVG